MILDGWYGFKLTQASETPEFRGIVPDTNPVFIATKRMDAPWPDVRVVLPLAPWIAQAWQGEARVSRQEIAEAIGDEMEAAVERELARARRGLGG